MQIVRFESLNEQVSVALYDSSGRLAKTVCSKAFDSGIHEFLIDLVGLDSGNYLLTIHQASGKFNKRLIKVKHI